MSYGASDRGKASQVKLRSKSVRNVAVGEVHNDNSVPSYVARYMLVKANTFIYHRSLFIKQIHR